MQIGLVPHFSRHSAFSNWRWPDFVFKWSTCGGHSID